MPGFGGFYKGEKKKSKKDKDVKIVSGPQPIVLPEIISKKKKDY